MEHRALPNRPSTPSQNQERWETPILSPSPSRISRTSRWSRSPTTRASRSPIKSLSRSPSKQSSQTLDSYRINYTSEIKKLTDEIKLCKDPTGKKTIELRKRLCQLQINCDTIRRELTRRRVLKGTAEQYRLYAQDATIEAKKKEIALLDKILALVAKVDHQIPDWMQGFLIRGDRRHVNYGRRDKGAQLFFRDSLKQMSLLPGDEQGDRAGKIWCPIEGAYLKPQHVRAGHIFPYCEGTAIMDTMFGTFNELNSVRNGILMAQSVEKFFDIGKIWLSPDVDPTDAHAVAQWIDSGDQRVYIIHLSPTFTADELEEDWLSFFPTDDDNNDSQKLMRQRQNVASLEGRKVHFRGTQPRARYLYWHYLRCMKTIHLGPLGISTENLREREDRISWTTISRNGGTGAGILHGYAAHMGEDFTAASAAVELTTLTNAIDFTSFEDDDYEEDDYYDEE